ncbi:MAG TPA: GNAT family N-acetyltransferase [Trebonia sp.]|jgi:ribosomal protein S18 acetylase RimI-like enzyme|nr:GNAT family N-acetyltransferase [Trebonia sp.]
MGAVGALRVGAYEAQDLLGFNPSYAATLAALGTDGRGTVLVAARDGEDAGTGRLLGTVMLDPWHEGSEVARDRREAEVRALAVAPQAQGQGVGRGLMLAVIGQARAAGARRLLLSTQPTMKAAQALYLSLGFARLPELDWSPVPEATLLGFGLVLG